MYRLRSWVAKHWYSWRERVWNRMENRLDKEEHDNARRG